MSKAGKKSQRVTSSSNLRELGLKWSPDSNFSPEEVYAKNSPIERRERMAQFFTPEPIAGLMAEWVVRASPSTVLDPSAGTGILARAIREKLPDARITCVDIDPAPLEVLRSCFLTDVNVECRTGDFLLDDTAKSFDAVIANPPYLRHQNLHYPFDIHGEIGARSDVKVSRLSNIYLLFVLEICRRLNKDGRAAIIIPSEWMNANYGSALKKYLEETGLLKHIIYFSSNTLAFSDALTTACILLLEKKSSTTKDIRVTYVQDKVPMGDLLATLSLEFAGAPGLNVATYSWATLSRTAKWDGLFQMGEQSAVDGLISLGDIVRTRRGIATGANDYFHLSMQAAASLGIQSRNLHDCIGKASDVSGLIFSGDDFSRVESETARTKLVDFRGELSRGESLYIELGVSLGLPERYVLSKRDPWYSMEECRPAPIWAAVFGRRGMRFIWNKAGVKNLTTFHGLYPIDLNEKQTACLVALLNSEYIQERAMKHRRVYGGGLIKFEPKDILQIEVPDVRVLSEKTLNLVIRELMMWSERRRSNPDAKSTVVERLVQELLANPGVAAQRELHNLGQAMRVRAPKA